MKVLSRSRINFWNFLLLMVIAQAVALVALLPLPVPVAVGIGITVSIIPLISPSSNGQPRPNLSFTVNTKVFLLAVMTGVGTTLVIYGIDMLFSQ